MNWDAIGAIGEVVGALSVLLTLIYLAKQIKDNSNLLTISAYQTAMDGYNEIAAKFFEDEQVARISGNLFHENFSSMSSIDEYRLNLMWRVYMNQNLKMLCSHELGVLPEGDWSRIANEISHLVSSTSFGKEYRRENPFFNDVWEAVDSYQGDRVSRFV